MTNLMGNLDGTSRFLVEKSLPGESGDRTIIIVKINV